MIVKSSINSVLILLLIVFAFVSSPASAFEICLASSSAREIHPLKRTIPDRPRLVLALSGGGLRGIAHIGVLEVLEEEGIKPDGIAGVSIGALIGGLYAGGLSLGEIAARLREIRFDEIMIDQPERRSLLLARKSEFSRHLVELRLTKKLEPILPGAIAPGQRLYQHLLDLTLDMPYMPIDDWNLLPVQLNILATNLHTGDPVVFDHGDFAAAIRASMAVPLLFDPLMLDSLQLVDGGISSNIPVDLARSMKADVVLAVDLTADLYHMAPPFKPWQIVDQVTTILERDMDSVSLSRSNLVVSPVIEENWNSGDVVEGLRQAGRKAMLEALPVLKKLLTTPGNEDDSKQVYIRDIIVPFGEDQILPQTGDWLGTTTSLGEIRHCLRSLYQNGTVLHAEADYDSLEETLRFHIQQTPPLLNVIFTGNRLIPDSLLRAEFSALIGRRLDFDKTEAALRNVLLLYRNQGYVVAECRDVEFDTTTSALVVTIDEGNLSQLEFRGLNHSPRRALAKEVPVKKGKPITKEAVLKGVSNLFATGLFRSVYPVIQRDKANGNGWNLVFYMQEHPSPPLRLGLAYQAQKRARGFAEITWTSPFNYAARMVLFSAIGELDNEHRISFLVDKVLGVPMLYNLTIGYGSRERAEYDRQHHDLDMYREERFGINLEMGGQVPSWGLLAATARSEQHINKYNLQEDQYHLSAVGAKLALDTHDRYPYPRRGIRFDAGMEFTGDFLASEAEFVRLWSSLESNLPIANRYTLGIRLLGRTADRTTPHDEQFRLGGIHEFPGLNLDEMIGLVQVAGGLELRFDLLSRMLSDTYLGIRLDTGRSWEDPQARLVRKDLLASTSVYIAFDTILGPLHLQLSHLFPAVGIPDQNIFFIQAGNQF